MRGHWVIAFLSYLRAHLSIKENRTQKSREVAEIDFFENMLKSKSKFTKFHAWIFVNI